MSELSPVRGRNRLYSLFRSATTPGIAPEPHFVLCRNDEQALLDVAYDSQMREEVAHKLTKKYTSGRGCYR